MRAREDVHAALPLSGDADKGFLTSSFWTVFFLGISVFLDRKPVLMLQGKDIKI